MFNELNSPVLIFTSGWREVLWEQNISSEPKPLTPTPAITTNNQDVILSVVDGQRDGLAAASEIRVYIQDDDNDKEDQDNIEKMSSEESVNWQELEETPRKKKRITKRAGNAARWSNDLLLFLIDEYEARPGPAFGPFFRMIAGELSTAITNFFGRLTMWMMV